MAARGRARQRLHRPARRDRLGHHLASDEPGPSQQEDRPRVVHEFALVGSAKYGGTEAVAMGWLTRAGDSHRDSGVLVSGGSGAALRKAVLLLGRRLLTLEGLEGLRGVAEEARLDDLAPRVLPHVAEAGLDLLTRHGRARRS